MVTIVAMPIAAGAELVIEACSEFTLIDSWEKSLILLVEVELVSIMILFAAVAKVEDRLGSDLPGYSVAEMCCSSWLSS